MSALRRRSLSVQGCWHQRWSMIQQGSGRSWRASMARYVTSAPANSTHSWWRRWEEGRSWCRGRTHRRRSSCLEGDDVVQGTPSRRVQEKQLWIKELILQVHVAIISRKWRGQKSKAGPEGHSIQRKIVGQEQNKTGGRDMGLSLAWNKS